MIGITDIGGELKGLKPTSSKIPTK